VLDRARPFAEVYGLPGAVFEQDGKFFRTDGSEAKSLGSYDEPTVSVSEEIIPAVTCIEQPSLPVEMENGRNLEDMHWRHLKALIESFGGEWTTRKDAIEFMKGK
jgi:hypothetical protein